MMPIFKLLLRLLIQGLIILGAALIVLLLLFVPNMSMTFARINELNKNSFTETKFDPARIANCQKNDVGVFCGTQSEPVVKIAGGKAYDLSFIPSDQKIYNAMLALLVTENSQLTTSGDRDSCGAFQQRTSEWMDAFKPLGKKAEVILNGRGISLNNVLTPEEKRKINAQVAADASRNIQREQAVGVIRDKNFAANSVKYYQGFDAVCKRMVEQLGNSFFDELQIERFRNQGLFGEGSAIDKLDINSPKYTEALADILYLSHRPAPGEEYRWKGRLKNNMEADNNYLEAHQRAINRCSCNDKVSCIHKPINNA